MAVKVKRERPDQRRHHRVTAPLFVDVGGWRLRTTDWSLGGLRLDGYPDAVPAPGTEIDLHLTLPFQGFEVSFDAKAEVVRNDPPAGMFAVQFTEIGERERELMSHFIEELIRGSMSDVEDTINRIDVPVTPASLKPDTSPAEEMAVQRWPLKTIVMSGVYVLLGLIVFGYTAMLVYTNFYRLEVRSAVISAPVDEVRARADGRIVWRNLAEGSEVQQGQILVEVADTELEREIDMADIAVRQQQAKLTFLKARQLDELQRAESYATVDLKNVRQAKLALEGLEAAMAAAEMKRNRMTALHRQGYATDGVRDEAERDWFELKKRVDAARIELQSRSQLAQANSGRRFYTGDNVVGDLGRVEAEAQLAKHEIELSQQRRDLLKRHRERLSVKAPFGGRLVRLLRADNVQVRRGDAVAVIERPRARQVKAFLKQEEINRVGLGAPVDVFVPSLGERLKGRVISIDRTAGFVREQDQRDAGGYTWRGQEDRSGEVIIEVDAGATFQTSEAYRPGTPVVVVFPRYGGHEALQSVQSSLLRGTAVQ